MYQDSGNGSICKHHCRLAVKIIVVLFGASFLLFWLYRFCKVPRHRRLAPTIRHAPVATVPATATPASISNARISPQVLASLPIFVHSSTDGKSKVECPVCLTEFEDGDEGRFLPACLHRFHAECIDMWFLSHSTCPLCRTIVEVHVSTE